MKKRPSITLVAALLGMLATFAAAQSNPVAGAPKFIDYQGQILRDDGTPFAERNTDGTSNPDNFVMHFSIYGEASGDAEPLWREKQIVTVDHGLFSVRLGEGIEVDTDPRPNLDSVFHGGVKRYLGLTVIEDPNNVLEEIKPRLQFLAVPYASVAERAKIADGVQFGAITGDHIQANTITANQLATGAVTEDVIADGAIGGQHLGNDAIEGRHLTDRAVGSNELALNSVTSSHIKEKAVGSHQLAEAVDFESIEVNEINAKAGRENLGLGRNGNAAVRVGKRGLRLDNKDGEFKWEVFLSSTGTSVDSNDLIFRPTGDPSKQIYFSTAGAIRAPGFISNSDRRLKTEIAPLDNTLERVLKMQAASYALKDGPDGTREVGLVAQDVEVLFPGLVAESNDGMKGIHYDRVAVYLIPALQELHAEEQADRAAKDAQIESLQKENLAVRKRLDRLEKLVEGLGK